MVVFTELKSMTVRSSISKEREKRLTAPMQNTNPAVESCVPDISRQIPELFVVQLLIVHLHDLAHIFLHKIQGEIALSRVAVLLHHPGQGAQKPQKPRQCPHLRQQPAYGKLLLQPLNQHGGKQCLQQHRCHQGQRYQDGGKKELFVPLFHASHVIDVISHKALLSFAPVSRDIESIVHSWSLLPVAIRRFL